MNWDWFNILTPLLQLGYNFFWDLYNDTMNPLVKMLILGGVSSFTSTIVIVNLLLIFFVIRQINQQWIKASVFLIVGKLIGTFLVFLLLRNLFDQQFLILINISRIIISIFILSIGILSIFYFREEMLSKWWSNLGSGLLLSFFIGPTVYTLLRGSPFVYEGISGGNLFLFPVLYSFSTLTWFLLALLIIYGFEFDKMLSKRIKAVNIFTSIIHVLLGISTFLFYL